MDGLGLGASKKKCREWFALRCVVAGVGVGGLVFLLFFFF